VMQDFVKVSNIAADEKLFDERDLQRTLDKIDILDYHQEREHKGVRFSCYRAGHVLGASMFLIEIDGVKILYTGDYSREEDRHLKPAELPNCEVDVLIVESTYGV
jgi:cleavage and polyadenylation specificity factor subunit 3